MVDLSAATAGRYPCLSSLLRTSVNCLSSVSHRGRSIGQILTEKKPSFATPKVKMGKSPDVVLKVKDSPSKVGVVFSSKKIDQGENIGLMKKEEKAKGKAHESPKRGQATHSSISKTSFKPTSTSRFTSGPLVDITNAAPRKDPLIRSKNKLRIQCNTQFIFTPFHSDMEGAEIGMKRSRVGESIRICDGQITNSNGDAV
ncbi:hypothetical protein Scep_016776 [Stephania cephalantha]|uniref:Uncharacterized protein n=1 Tax=Stephania cephalantha TaxID=152367 RepID=A0AAP0IPL2_9MAGN